MHAKAIAFLITALLATVASGQTPAPDNVDRVFHFTYTDTAQDLQETATVIRAIAEMQQVSVDTVQKTMTARGTTGQIALVDWLVSQLDKPANPPPLGQQSSATHQGPSGSGDDLVQVFYIAHADTVQKFQEMVTSVRSIVDMRWTFTYTALRAVAVRGTAGQLALAEWLYSALDKPAGGQALALQNSAPYNWPAGGSDNVVRVFYLPHTRTVQNLQEIATSVRSIGDMRRLFTYNALSAVAVRGTAAQIGLAEWLLGELDNPTKGQATHEYRLAGSADDVVRVFYLTPTNTVASFQKICTQVRSSTEIRRLFTYNAPRAAMARGTTNQIALAERMFSELDKPAN
jgi:hypothetical protein